MYKKVFVFVISLPVFALALNVGDKCTTPNGETATCKRITECNVIKVAVIKREEGAAEFAKKSQCGWDIRPLVCCGTKAKLNIAKFCTTPNGQLAKCVPISTCSIIINAIATRDKDAIEFAKSSQCDYENEALVCCGSEAYPLRTNLLPNRSACGIQKGDNRIWGGTITEYWEFPWIALLRYNLNNGSDAGFKCGGTLINSRYVLTAAHCVSLRAYQEINLISVRLGEWRISTVSDCVRDMGNQECADPVVDLSVEEKIVHSEYNRKTVENDIALLRLERNVKFSDYIQPICLPVRESPDPSPNSEMYSAGWGATENSTSSDYKLKIKLPIVSRSTCNLRITNIGTIGVNRICAGGEYRKDTCRGDSGGPLMGLFTGKTSSSLYFQEGIISRGIGCGSQDLPGVYIRVAKFMDWIIENLQSF